MNMFKSNGGFTLVELIVVIAILAILAGVAVPAYSGYISKANDTADTTVLGAIKTAVQGAYATTETVSEIEITASKGVISKIVVNGDATKVLYDSSKTDVSGWVNGDLKIFLNDAMPTLKEAGTFASGAEWSVDTGKWTGK